MPDNISGITGALEGLKETGSLMGKNKESENSPVSFGEKLQEALNDVNEKQKTADEMTEKFVAGETDDIHELMIKTQEARLALQLTVQTTSKLVESYQELSRMQI